jgi:AcrR family transcriptional regulator
MARPSQIDEQRKRLLPVVCQVFSQWGYHRTTTAELARQCGVRENILYRLWRDKKAMFLAAIDDIFQSRVARWGQILAERPTLEQAADALVAYEAKHQGEFGFYRVVFTALVEADDPEIHAAIKSMYGRFHARLRELLEASRQASRKQPPLDAAETAWALIGLATVSNIIRELELARPRERQAMFAHTAQCLLQGDTR